MAARDSHSTYRRNSSFSAFSHQDFEQAANTSAQITLNTSGWNTVSRGRTNRPGNTSSVQQGNRHRGVPTIASVAVLVITGVVVPTIASVAVLVITDVVVLTIASVAVLVITDVVVPTIASVAVLHSRRIPTQESKSVNGQVFVPGIVYRLSQDKTNGHVMSNSGDEVYFRKDELISSVRVGSLIWGILKTVRGNLQLHNVVSDELIQMTNFSEIQSALKLKELNGVMTTSLNMIDSCAENIIQNPDNAYALIRKALSKTMHGKPKLRYSGMFGVNNISSNDMFKFILGVLNTDVHDTTRYAAEKASKSEEDKSPVVMYNKTANVFGRWVDIQKVVNSSDGIGKLSKRMQKLARRRLVSKSDIVNLIDNDEFMATMEHWVESEGYTPYFFSSVREYINVTTNDYQLPIPTKDVVSILAKVNSVTLTRQLFSLLRLDSVLISSSHLTESPSGFSGRDGTCHHVSSQQGNTNSPSTNYSGRASF